MKRPLPRVSRASMWAASADISRLDDDGRILEHWDVLQIVPDDSANSTGKF